MVNLAMRIVVLVYFVVTLILSGSMLFGGSFWDGVVFLVGSLLGFAGGSGMRASFYLGHRRAGIIIGIALGLTGMAMVFYSDVVVSLLGQELMADNWVGLAFAVGFFAARREDVAMDTAKSVHLSSR